MSGRSWFDISYLAEVQNKMEFGKEVIYDGTGCEKRCESIDNKR